MRGVGEIDIGRPRWREDPAPVLKTLRSYLEIAPDKAPDVVNAVIEVPIGSTNKVEYDPELGIFRLDRVLYSPMHYPGDYGFIPGTYADDGDPVDVVVLMNNPTFPGCVLSVRPLGFLEMSDEKGQDQKDGMMAQICPKKVMWWW